MVKQLLIIKHDAKKAGLHYDLRLEVKSNQYLSFRLRYDASKALVVGYAKKKIVMIETNMHTKKEAEYTGLIADGEYGAGELSNYFSSKVDIIKTDAFKSRVVLKIKNGKYQNQTWVLFKLKKDIWILFRAKD